MAKKKYNKSSYELTHDGLQSLLAYNVPRFIQHIKDKGGVSDEEFRWLQCEKESPEYPSYVILVADEYIFFPNNQKKFEQGLFVLTLALAIMSFFPGGVRVMGLEFSSELEGYQYIDTSET